MIHTKGTLEKKEQNLKKPAGLNKQLLRTVRFSADELFSENPTAIFLLFFRRSKHEIMETSGVKFFLTTISYPLENKLKQFCSVRESHLAAIFVCAT